MRPEVVKVPSPSAPAREWILPPPVDARLLDEIASAFSSYHPALVRILINRGLTTPEEIEVFTNPRLAKLSDPFELKDMDRAVERIIRAIENREKVLIHGDYDADGITATALLSHFLKACDVPHTYFLPNRLDDGYGLGEKCVMRCAEEKIPLLITLDCGIRAVKEAQLARTLGVDLIVTDHHAVEGQIPDCCAVVNPKQKDCTAGMEELSGVGVSFKLIQALIKEGRRSNRPWASNFDLKQYLDLVLIGTLADKVPLRRENRILVRHGLKALRQTDKVGLRLLANGLTSQDAGALSMHDVLFRLIPRLNASGRVDSPTASIELLLTDDEAKGQELVYMLQEFNVQRQKLEEAISRQIDAQIAARVDLARERVIVLGAPDWHIGVLGIIASKLCNKYNRGVILFQIKPDSAKASARMPEGGPDILDLIGRCAELVEEFGGHMHAAGISLRPENLAAFRERINEQARLLDHAPQTVRRYVDAQITLRDTTARLVQDLEQLEPFGTENPPPLLMASGLLIKGSPFLVKNNHVKVRLCQGNTEMDAIGFGMAGRFAEITALRYVDVLFSPQIDTYSGRRNVFLKLEDFRPGQAPSAY